MGLVLPELLSSIDEISAEWLQAVFSEAGKDLPAISRVRSDLIGAGNTGITVKTEIEYEDPDADAPGSVVCKFHPHDPMKIELIKQHGVFLVEEGAQKLLAEHSEAATQSYRDNIVSSLYLTMMAAMQMPDEGHMRTLLTLLFERNCAAVQHWMNL